MGSSLCGAQTAEYGSDVAGFQIGNYNVKPPIFVDDIAVIIRGIQNIVDAHLKALTFSKRKRLGFGHKKCVMLTINGKKGDIDPFLTIDDHVIEKVRLAKYLGDLFNDHGNNKDLIEARAKKANGKTISILSMCEEGNLGKYLILVMLLLYRTMFLATMLFNAEAWSHMTSDNIQKLKVEQLKYLKRTMAVPTSTPNCFVYLELGVLPIDSEIDLRQLNFLHHILNLEHDDPVRRVYHELRKFAHEKNWSNNIHDTLNKYTINMEDEEIRVLSRTEWKELIKKKVYARTLDILNAECGRGSKTAKLFYEEFKCQEYVTALSPREARALFRVRSRTVLCKKNQKSSWTGDLFCRFGCQVEESQEHVINCPAIHGNDISKVDTSFICKKFDIEEYKFQISDIARRVVKAREAFEE